MKSRFLAVAALAAIVATDSLTAAPFGGEDDVAFANRLWQAMVADGLVGTDAIMSTPYEGTHPHGIILDTLDAKTTVDGERNIAIIKRNYGGDGVSKSGVANNPDKYLKAVTVMFKRDGYDTDNKDWFWVKYSPDGSVLNNPKNIPLAGRVAKGMDAGCIACHTPAPGGDMVFNHDRYAE
jgi:hypothetical protein